MLTASWCIDGIAPDAPATIHSAVQELRAETLKMIAIELTQKPLNSVTVDKAVGSEQPGGCSRDRFRRDLRMGTPPEPGVMGHVRCHPQRLRGG